MKKEIKPIKQLIINSPYEEPKEHWELDESQNKHIRKIGRREAGYIIQSQSQKKHDEFGQFVSIDLVNQIRPKVKEWREKGYSGVTGITNMLLHYWRKKGLDDKDGTRFFFCQLEAIETLIFLIEAPDHLKNGVDIQKDKFLERLCCKMATGTGKTFVMAMLIVWQVLNKVKYKKDTRFSKNILIIAPNKTVESRLQVLNFHSEDETYYFRYGILPNQYTPYITQGKIVIQTWNQLMFETDEKIKAKKGIDKRGALSDEAYIRKVLGDMSNAKNLVVLNDEAHHAWRLPSELKHKKIEGMSKEEQLRSSRWIEGLDRIQRARGISNVFDFSATPFPPGGKKAKKEQLFPWIVSDFGLTDAIESGLVKTPRFVVRDDLPINIKINKSQLYHIYENENIKKDLNSKKCTENKMLPQLVSTAYTYLSYDWKKTLDKWKKSVKRKSDFKPPVLISIVNKKETAHRIKYSLSKKKMKTPDEFSNQSDTILIHSGSSEDNTPLVELNEEVLKKHFDKGEGSKKDKENFLKEMVDSTGDISGVGKPIKHIISVAMLSEGWSCNTVTHILGLRAFTSQLLCEQTIGRGLRRASYEINEKGLFDPEYVNVFGVPFSYLPSEEVEGELIVTQYKESIYPDHKKIKYKIDFPNILRIDYELKNELSIDFNKSKTLVIDGLKEIPEKVIMSPKIQGRDELDQKKEINLTQDLSKMRMNTILYEIGLLIYDETDFSWKKKIHKSKAIKQIINLVKKYKDSNLLKIEPASFSNDPEKEKRTLVFTRQKIAKEIFRLITNNSTTHLKPVFDISRKFLSTEDAKIRRTSKKVKAFRKTHMNLCVVDSSWEMSHAECIDQNENVSAWVKNDGIGLKIGYIDEKGSLRDYIPDFIIKLNTNDHILLEVKGAEKNRDLHKWTAAEQWCKAISKSEDFNENWYFKTSSDPSGRKIDEIIDEIIKLHKKAS